MRDSQQEGVHNQVDTITLMLELQKEMETLKKKSNEELNVLREENAKLRRKIKTTEKVGTEKKDPSHSNEHT